MRSIAIIGLGNPLLSDEGIGVRVVEELSRRGELPEGVDAVDLGTGGLAVLHEMKGRRKVVFVDCAMMGEAPGTLRRFTPAEVASRKVQTRFSLHEGDLLQTLELAKQTDSLPEEVVILGIEPATVEQGMTLSGALAERLGEYADRALAEAATSPHRAAEGLEDA